MSWKTDLVLCVLVNLNAVSNDNRLKFLKTENRNKCNMELLALAFRVAVPNISSYHNINLKVSKVWWLKVKAGSSCCLC